MRIMKKLNIEVSGKKRFDLLMTIFNVLSAKRVLFLHAQPFLLLIQSLNMSVIDIG